MAVLALKSEPKCKLCSHPARSDIDALLELRSERATDDNGVHINQDYVLARLAEWGVRNPTRENIAVHWKKHCQRIKGEQGDQLGEQQQKALDELMAILDSGEYPDNFDGQLQRLWDLGLAEVRRRVAAGNGSGITADQMRWIAAERTRRSHNETQHDLLSALVGGAAKAIAAGAAKQLPKPDVIDGELVSES